MIKKYELFYTWDELGFDLTQVKEILKGKESFGLLDFDVILDYPKDEETLINDIETKYSIEDNLSSTFNEEVRDRRHLRKLIRENLDSLFEMYYNDIKKDCEEEAIKYAWKSLKYFVKEEDIILSERAKKIIYYET